MIIILAKVIEVYSYVLFASVIVSWLPIDREHPLVRLLDGVTEPLLGPIRKIVSPQMTGGLDFSPMIAILALNMLSRMLFRF